MYYDLVLRHWRSGLLGALCAAALVLILAAIRTPQYAGSVEVMVLPKRVDLAQAGPYARQAETPAEMTAQFQSFVMGDGLRKFLSSQDQLDLGGGAFGRELVEDFRRRISMEILDEAGGMRLRVVDAWPRRAALLAEGLVLAYRGHLEETEKERRRLAVETTTAKLTGLESKLNILRQAVLSFHRMHLEEVEKYGGEKREDWRQALLVGQIDTRIGVLEERLEQLSGLEPEEFLKQVNRWKVMDQGLMNLAAEFLDQGGTVKALDGSGLSKTHVEVVAAHQRLEDSRKRLVAGMDRLVAKMKEEVKQEKDHRASLLAEREETWTTVGEIAKRLEETKSIYEEETAALGQTQAKLYAAQMEASLPVRVLDFDATRGAKLEMQGPSSLMDLLLAPLMGVLCGFLTVLVRAWQVERRGAVDCDPELIAAWPVPQPGTAAYAVAA